MYLHFLNKNLPDQLTQDISQDVTRADLSNHDWLEKCENGQNALFNVLKAYAIYDPEVNYGQGMNILAA